MKKLLLKVLRKLGFLPQTQPSRIVHEDEEILTIQENLIFAVYWKSLAIGTGPAVILKAFEKEILKYDCFGKEKGHYHVAPHYNFRIYFVEDSVEGQIQRTVQDLKINGLKYLSMQTDPRIKTLIPNIEQFNSQLKLVESKLLENHLKIQKLSEEKKQT